VSIKSLNILSLFFLKVPPHGQEDLHDLQSIFEVSHLKKHVVFLDTQCLFVIFIFLKYYSSVEFLDRMPPQIGKIISEAVYENKLKSNPLHPVTDQTIACYFIDVPGKESSLSGGSFKAFIFYFLFSPLLIFFFFQNDPECQMVLKIAKKLQEQEKNYRIITPYAGQTTLIESSMKTWELDWKDKCFNVDSFQGELSFMYILFMLNISFRK